MKKLIIISICFLSLAAGFVLRPAFYNAKPEEKNKQRQLHYSLQSKKDDFIGIQNFENTTGEKNKIFGAIVSHHLLAEPDIAELFGKLKAQSPKEIVLVGPNHFNSGSAPVLVSMEDYRTPFGDLENNHDLGNRLVDAGLAVNEEYPFNKEHAISSLAGYIKLTFPKSRITPLIIKRGSSLKEAENLGLWLAENLPDDSLLIISADFSHHFNLEKTLSNDRKNLEILKSFDISNVDKMEVDSKQSLALLFSYLESKKAKNFKYHYTNAAFLLRNKDYEDVTSYFFAFYLKGVGEFTEYKQSFWE